MRQTRNILSILALIIALIALAISMLAWVRATEAEKEYDRKLAEMEQLQESLQQEIDALNSESGPVPAETLVTDYECYCNLFIDSWSFGNGALTVHTAYAQVLSETAAPDGAAVYLFLNGDLRISMPIELTPGEGSGSYVKELTNLALELPELLAPAEGDYLELCLNVPLSDGRVLTASGGSWEFAGGELSMIAG